VIAQYESASAQVSGARNLDDQAGDLPPELREQFRARWTAVYDGPWKFVSATNGEAHLYNLERDPAEEHDVSARELAVEAKLRAMLPARVAGEPGEPPSDVLDAEITAHLEGLGYL
jgi:hypothetical protein